MPRYTYRCSACGTAEDHFVTYQERLVLKPLCPSCGAVAAYQFPLEAIKGFQPFAAYYDEALDCDINDRGEKRRILKELDLHEAGDPVKGARNLDKHAPHHVKPRPPRGIPYTPPDRREVPLPAARETKAGKWEPILPGEVTTL